jgi:hypothetical protein
MGNFKIHYTSTKLGLSFETATTENTTRFVHSALESSSQAGISLIFTKVGSLRRLSRLPAKPCSVGEQVGVTTAALSVEDTMPNTIFGRGADKAEVSISWDGFETIFGTVTGRLPV